jgi:hypothetical protein
MGERFPSNEWPASLQNPPAEVQSRLPANPAANPVVMVAMALPMAAVMVPPCAVVMSVSGRDAAADGHEAGRGRNQ